MTGEPQADWQRHHYISWVYEGGLTGEYKEHLKQVPEEMREYVRERVETLFSFGKNKWRV